MLPCWPGCRPCSTNHWTVLLAVQLQDNHPSAKTSGMQRFRLSTVLCPSARRKPLTCAEINPRWHIRKQGTKRAQPPQWRAGAESLGRSPHRHAQVRLDARGCPCHRPLRGRRQPVPVDGRARSDLTIRHSSTVRRRIEGRNPEGRRAALPSDAARAFGQGVPHGN